MGNTGFSNKSKQIDMKERDDYDFDRPREKFPSFAWLKNEPIHYKDTQGRLYIQGSTSGNPAAGWIREKLARHRKSSDPNDYKKGAFRPSQQPLFFWVTWSDKPTENLQSDMMLPPVKMLQTKITVTVAKTPASRPDGEHAHAEKIEWTVLEASVYNPGPETHANRHVAWIIVRPLDIEIG